jgi:hypothetical protein
MHVVPAVLAITLALSAAASAATYRWEHELCRSTATFDPAKTDRAALIGTVKLLYDEPSYVPVTPMNTPEQVAKVDPARSKRECDAVVERRKALKLLPLPGAEAFRKILLDEVQDTCALEAATIASLKNPSALRDYKPAVQACGEFIDALEGKTDFERAWLKVVETTCRDNASVAACRERALADGRKPDGMLWKRLLVLNFGWNNCAILQMKLNALETQREDARKTLIAALKKQFKVKSVCERP